MSFKFRSVLSMSIGFILLLLAAPVYAQDGAPDPVDLATRLLGYNGEVSIPEPSPIYKPGDTLQFWVSKAGNDEPVQITAELAGVGVNTYVWVEQGTAYDATKMGEFAGQLAAIYGILRVKSNYGVVNTVPETPADLERIPTLQMPDVDNDPHLYILYATNLTDNRTSVYNPVNSLENSLVSSDYSNQHEMVTVNTSNFPGVELDAPAYTNILARQFYAMLAYYNNPAQPLWLQGATAWDTLLQIQQRSISADDLRPFFAAPETPLTRLPGLASTGAEFGVQQLFLRYVLQRFGFQVFRDLFTGSGSGLAALDQALAARNITDLVTGDPVTARDVFADFVMANALNRDVGDGRYLHVEPAARGLAVSVLTAEDQFEFDLPDLPVNQLGTNYIGLRATQPVRFTVFFGGQDGNTRLPMPAGDETNHFYWSGDAPHRDATLTRAFDLGGVEGASLTFDAWYSLADGWNYAYVEVSTDEGATWDILPASSMTTVNPQGLAYGVGFSGISNAEKPRPFPYLGVELDTDGLTLTEIIADGPLAGTDIQVGDTIAGYEGKVWEGQPNLLAFLADYEPGDTVNFYIQRGETFFDAEVILGSHPARRKIPAAIWMPQTVDLSAYAGKTILLRFESISLAGNEDQGIAIDNITIPEIGFNDDAESGIPGWTLDGWQQTTNEVRQQFLVQAALVGAEANKTQVMRLIGPADNVVSGQWEFTLQADEMLLLAVSGLNDNTTALGRYTLSARTATNEAPSS